MYLINRGTGFTNALFMNCDHSLLTYSFYKKPKFVLRLFQIRLREIIKINAVPALVIGAGLSAILYVSGGTENPLNYVVLVCSVTAMSVFFSIHYLTVYYLLQPYTAGTEMKSGTYRIVMALTYVGCYALMNLRLPILVFGVACIAFCVLQFAVGKYVGARYGDKITAGQALGQKNTVLIIWISYTFFTPITSIAGGFYSVWHNLINSWQLFQQRKLDEKK